MANQQHRRYYVAALGLAACGFLLDRVFLSGQGLGPGAAAAASISAGASHTAPTLPAEPIPEQTLAQRLAAVAGTLNLAPAETRNAFLLSGVQSRRTDNDELFSRAEEFQKAHRLQAILSGPSGNIAMVSQIRLEIGQQIDGFTLAAIDPAARTALFVCDGVGVRLSLK